MKEQASDEVLMLRYKDGDLVAFEILLAKYQQPLFAFAYKFCNDYHLAQDLVQEVFLRLIKAAKNYEPRAKFSTYLYTFAHNICIDHIRRNKKRKNVSLSDPIGDGSELTVEDSMKSNQPDPEKELHQKTFEKALHEAVDQLPPEQREVFLLREQMNLPFEEIAKVLGASPARQRAGCVTLYKAYARGWKASFPWQT